MSPQRLKKLIERLFALKGAQISKEELNEKIDDFYAIASVLNLSDSDEVFGFLAMFEVYTALNRQEMMQMKKAYFHISNDAEKAFDSMLQAKELAVKTLAEKAQISLERNVSEKQKAITESLRAGLVKIAEQAALTNKTRTLGRWICGTVFAVFLVIVGLFWAIYSSAFNAGYEKGVAETRNTEFMLAQRDEFWTSELGKRLEVMGKNGNLDRKKLNFVESAAGTRAYDLFERNALEKRLSFPETKIGSLVMAYVDQSPDTLIEILQCKKEGWEIRPNQGRNFCFPTSTYNKKSSGYFLMPK